MRASTLDLLACPACRAPLRLDGGEQRDEERVEQGELVCTGCGVRAPVVRGIPRFVPPGHYAENFGFQWNRFAELQVDRVHGGTMSHDRFYLQTGLTPEWLKGRRVLEAGCGGGRFTQIVLDADAEIVAADLSNAVDKNLRINGDDRPLHLLQASILELPLRPAQFDLVFCFGVLQHTPDPAATFRALVPFVKPGGRLAVDIYAAHPKQTLHLKYAMRPVTRRMDHERLLHWIERAAPPLVSLALAMRRVPKVGRALTRLVPLKLHDGVFEGVPYERAVKLAVLETFDALSPAYDRPRSLRTLRRWFDAAGFVDVEARSIRHGHNYASGTKPAR